MADKELERLAHADYWDERYTEAGPDGKVHEWFRSFDDLEEFFDSNLFRARAPEAAPRILHLGSGDSTIPRDLAAKGYTNQICVDFSAVAVETMSRRHADVGGIEWKQMDVRDMREVPSESVDVAFDKGTLDAMIHGSPWSPPPDVFENTGRYLREVRRVLKPDGVFIYVTYRQPRFIDILMERDEMRWHVEVEHLGRSDSSFGYHGYVCRPVKAAGDA